MELNLMQSLMMGFGYGLTEPMAMSSDAHRGLLQCFFGIRESSPLLMLMCHAAVLAVLLIRAPLELSRLSRTRRQLRLPPKRRTHHPEQNSVNTLKLLRTAGLLTAAGTLLGTYTDFMASGLHILAFTLLIGGVMLWLPGHCRTGNKDARHLMPADGMIMGAGAALGAVPGFSCVGLCMSAASVRGVDRRYALRFAWILLCIRLVVLMGIDILQVVGLGMELGWVQILACLAGAAAAAVGAWLAVQIMLTLIKTKSITGFGYYSWGMALLCLILYLMV